MSPEFEKDLIRALNRLAGAEEIKAQVLGKVATAIEDVAIQIKWLGAGNNSDQMGAVEFLATQVRDAGNSVASAISNRE